MFINEIIVSIYTFFLFHMYWKKIEKNISCYNNIYLNYGT